MSYFIFGCINQKLDEEKLTAMKLSGKEKGIYFWFDKEISFIKIFK